MHFYWEVLFSFVGLISGKWYELTILWSCITLCPVEQMFICAFLKYIFLFSWEEFRKYHCNWICCNWILGPANSFQIECQHNYNSAFIIIGISLVRCHQIKVIIHFQVCPFLNIMAYHLNSYGEILKLAIQHFKILFLTLDLLCVSTLS